MDKLKIEEILFKYRWYILGVSIGIFLLLIGAVSLTRQLPVFESDKVEILSAENETAEAVVEIGGAIEKPGVYKMPPGSRVDDLLIASGGLSANADREWITRTLNRAAKLADGQKIFIPDKSQSANVISQNQNVNLKTETGGLININVASQKLLEELPGIGPVTAQKIIENRPYSAVEELITRKILKQKVYEENKDKLSVY